MNQNLFAALSCIQFIIIVAGLLGIVFNKQLMAWERKTMRRFRAWKRRVRRAICAWLMHKDGVMMPPTYNAPTKFYVNDLVKLIKDNT